MKKTLIILISLLAVLAFFAACKSEPVTSNTCTVTFDTDGASKVTSQSVTKGGTASEPATPTHAGWYFLRWSLTKNGTEAFDFKNTAINENTTIYAVWEKSYTLGQTGPAGGIIYYDVDADNTIGNNQDGLKSSECGWRFLELGKSDLTRDTALTFSWGPSSSLDTKTGLGEGKANTDLIAALGENYMPAYRIKGKDLYNNGFSDWFLPSKDELHEVYKALSAANLNNFASAWYWTSSADGSDNAWEENIGSNGNQTSASRTYGACVRPVRRF